MNTFNIPPQDVENPKEIAVRIPPSGPVPDFTGDANRLFIYTGIIKFGGVNPDDSVSRARIVLDISALHNRRFDGNPYRLMVDRNGNLLAAPVASLASLFGGDLDEAEDVVWAVDRADVEEDNQQHLRLLVDIAVGGTDMGLNRLSYQINIMARDSRGD